VVTKYQFTNTKKTQSKRLRGTKHIFIKLRKIIETLFLELCDQLRITNNYDKFFKGFETRPQILLDLAMKF
jgi:hypothetical protein